MIKTFTLILSLLIVTRILLAQGFQNIIEVAEHGISNGVRDSKQIDRDEAIMDAKLKAIEKAGVNIKSFTKVEDLILMKDWIESRAQAHILSNFKIIDIGYGEDGVYHVVFVGKVSTKKLTLHSSGEEGNRKFRYALLIIKEDEKKGIQLLTEVIDKHPNSESADNALWEILRRKYKDDGETKEVTNLFKKLKLYYPNSPFVKKYYELKKNYIPMRKLKKSK